MKSKIKGILNSFFMSDEKDDSSSVEEDKIATTVLFLELAQADFKVTKEEQQHINLSLQNFFDLSELELEEILEIAEKKRDERNDIWSFTHHIKNNYSRDKKLKIMDTLWQLVYSDGHMDKYEEALMRKITSLLGLSHGEMIASKLKAKG